MNNTAINPVPVLTFGLIGNLLLSCSSGTGKTERNTSGPNLIYVFADQWRAEATGYSGNRQVRTPNLDRLAGESVNFVTAISNCPVSSPARASMMTGQYPLTHGIFFNDKPLGDDRISIAEIYREHGYNTAYIGKWHLNGHPKGESRDEHRKLPVPSERRQGFDYWKVLECTHDYNNSLYYDNDNVQHIWQGYDAEIQTDSAIAYIRAGKDSPFILFLSWGPPHEPYHTAPDKYRDMYSDWQSILLRPNVPDSLSERAKKDIAGYYAHIAALDEYLGKILAAVKESGIEENTIFVFTSDHGDMLLSHGLTKKQKPWDESIRVPLLLRYPLKIKKARKVKIPFGTVDIMPTLLGLSGLPVPDGVEGTDFSDYLLGKNKPDIKSTLIMCPVPFHQWSFDNGGKEYRGVRTERYTFARDLNGPWLLYDNKTDPFQMKNLVNKVDYKKIQNELEVELNRLLDKSGDKFMEADYYMKKWNYDYD